MSDNPGYGFIPSPRSPKKELPKVPQANPPVVSNYFTIAINPQAILFVVLLAILVYLAIRLTSIGLRP
jgi:hypothetical protein